MFTAIIASLVFAGSSTLLTEATFHTELEPPIHYDYLVQNWHSVNFCHVTIKRFQLNDLDIPSETIELDIPRGTSLLLNREAEDQEAEVLKCLDNGDTLLTTEVDISEQK